MKKISVSLLSIALCINVWAQNSKVTSAIMHLQSYEKEQDTAELSAAKESIDDAAVYDKTKDEPKMYLYRGEVYITYFGAKLGKMVTKAIVAGNKDINKVKMQAYTDIDTNALCIAANSFIKVLQMVPTDYYADEAKQAQNLPSCLIYIENKALREYAAERYTTAFALYQKALLICSVLNKTDSAYKQNVEMAANSAVSAGNNAAAQTYYQKLIDLKYAGALPYRSLANMYFQQKDTNKAFDYLEKGRAQYPNDLSLIITETNYYITKHDYDKAVANLTLTINKIEQSPDKGKNKALLASLYSNLGSIYDHKANPKDDKGTDLPKPADYDSLFAKAELNYNKAIATDSNNFDVLYTAGALYFNHAVIITKQANDLPYNATDKYNKLMEQAKTYFLKAQPYFERGRKIKPGDAGNNNALMQVYANTGQNDKLQALKNQK